MKYDICVFGGCSLDLTYFANADGSYNSEPSIVAPGGKASNQAVAASRAGAKTTIITRLGNDDIGKKILDNLSNNDIDTSNVELVDGLNNDAAYIYVNEVDKDNDIKRVVGAVDSFTPDMIDKYSDVLLSSKIVVAQMKVPKEVSIKLINFCHEHNIPIIVTPCRPKKLDINLKENQDLIEKISFITCNKDECIAIFGTDDIEECVRRYPNRLIVTLGEDGLIYNNGTENVHIPAPQKEVVEDTTGAGDTFSGNFAALIAQGETLGNAIEKAQYASGMKIRHKTAQKGMPYKNELELFISERKNNVK